MSQPVLLGDAARTVYCRRTIIVVAAPVPEPSLLPVVVPTLIVSSALTPIVRGVYC
jgi:hypothetical protein